MKTKFLHVLVFCLLFSFLGCDPFSFPPPTGLASMGVHLVSIPACIRNEPNLEIKTQAFVDVINPDGSLSPFDDAVFYSSDANNNPSNIWNMGMVNIPASGFFYITLKSKVVIRGSACDKPFYPRDIAVNDPAHAGMYDNDGCCFKTTCCGCTDLPDEPPTLHNIDNQVHMQFSPTTISSLGQHINNSLVCFCCAY